MLTSGSAVRLPEAFPPRNAGRRDHPLLIRMIQRSGQVFYQTDSPCLVAGTRPIQSINTLSFWVTLAVCFLCDVLTGFVDSYIRASLRLERTKGSLLAGPACTGSPNGHTWGHSTQELVYSTVVVIMLRCVKPACVRGHAV